MAGRLQDDDDISRNARDQRHAVHRRDAGAAHHLHGGGAAVDGRRAGRAAGVGGQAAAKPDKPLYVTLKADLSLAVGNDMVLWGGLGPALDAQTSSDRNKRLFLRADKTVPYGELMRLMDTLRAAGYLKVALVGLEGPPVQGAPSAPAAPGAFLPSAPPATLPTVPSAGAEPSAP